MNREAWEPRQARACRGSYRSAPSRFLIHRLAHRFAPRYLLTHARFRWNNRLFRLLLLCVLEVARQTEHGAPATSVAGVYSFMGVRVRPAPPPPASAASTARAAGICGRSPS